MPEWLDNAIDVIVTWLDAHAVAIFIILAAALALHVIGKRLIGKAVRRMVMLDAVLPSEKRIEGKRQETLIRIFEGLFVVILWVVALMMALSEAGLPIGPMLAAAGVGGLALGFGGQYLIRDLITGAFIIIENQYRVGDVICVETICGEVEDITLRKTTLRDMDGVVHHIPHSELRIVSNRSRSYSRVNVDIGVSYAADLDRVEEVVNRVGRELAGDPAWKELVREEPRFNRVEELADSAVVIRVTGDTAPGEQIRVAGELRRRLKQAFDAEGIEIPFPQRVIHQKPGDVP
jgi:small conductance mechanosensitive channel